MHMLYIKKNNGLFKSVHHYLNPAATEVSKTQEMATLALARPVNPSSPAPPAGSVPPASATKHFCSSALGSNADFHLTIDQ